MKKLGRSDIFILFSLIFISLTIYLSGFYFSYTYLFDQIIQEKSYSAIRNVFEYAVMYLSFLFFVALLYKRIITRVFSVLLLVFISINFGISYTCYSIYNLPFNSGMIMSVIDTNFNEAVSMAGTYTEQIVVSIIFLFFNVFTVKRLSKIRFNKYLVIFVGVWLFLPFLFKIKHRFVKNKGGGSMIKSVYYHYNDFVSGYKLRDEFISVKKEKVNYSSKKMHKGINTIVFLIGESVTPSRMQLYGYHIPNTPVLQAEKRNMKIYKNAVSSAGITNLSVPLILSTIDPEEFISQKQKLADNIINFANYSGYQTYWLSTQTLSSSISVIASYAQHQKYIVGFDHVVLPELQKALNNPEKKLIILHLVGSHPNPCDKIPVSEKNNSNDILDCYDNSILYTDKIIGKVMNMLRNKDATFVYTSDHSLKIIGNKMIHCDSKESTKVPYFTWYSPAIKNTIYKNRGGVEIEILTQNTKIFSDLVEMMGYDSIKDYKDTKMKYLNLSMKKIDYSQLPE